MPARLLRLPLAAVLTAATVAALAACAPQDDSPSASSSGSATTAACTKDSLATHTKGAFTVGTDKPAYEPWFVDDDPSNGKGFESAVAYAVAAKLGFAQPDVKWEVVSFNQATAPGPKTFDVDINQISITDERKKNLDFSSGYYDVAQAVVTVKGSKAENAASIADLKKLKLGAQVGTTSYTAATETIAPDAEGRRLQHQRRRQGRAAERPDRRPRRRPAHRPVPGRRRPQGRQARRPDPDHRHARAVRHGAGQGQRAHRVRLAGRRRAARGRHAGQARAAVADQHGRGA